MADTRTIVVLIDMDGTLFDFDIKILEAVQRYDSSVNKDNMWTKINENPELKKIKNQTEFANGFFYTLPLIPGAKEAINRMIERGWKVYICSSPSVTSDDCHSSKNRIMKDIFGEELARRLILTKDKTMVRGDVLIDDRSKITGQYEPIWGHICFKNGYERTEETNAVDVLKGWSDDFIGKIEKIVHPNDHNYQE